MERTLVIIKPCALQRGLSGEIISRFEKKGLKLVALKMYRFTKENAAIELDRFFCKDDYFKYDSPLFNYLYAEDEI